MPTYTLRHKKSKKEKSEFMTIAEMTQWEKDNPDWEVACGAPVLGYNVYTVKPDNGFRDILNQIKKNNVGSTIVVP